MGLDMYAFTTEQLIPAVDFEEPKDAVKLFYWRKHPNLHGWFEKLYRRKGGLSDEFNCAQLQLDARDLDLLERAIRGDALPYTEGFFFGRSDGLERADDEHFIHKARDALANNRKVFYTSWW